jgi:hypothetical protein
LLTVGHLTSSFTVIVIAPLIGYGLVGWAWWHLASNDAVPHRTVRYCSRLFALAALAFAASWSGLVYNQVDFRLSWSVGSFQAPHWRLLLASDVSSAIGFLLAALGLWSASNARAPTPRAEDGVPVAVGAIPDDD